jgi:hypothetical protein
MFLLCFPSGVTSWTKKETLLEGDWRSTVQDMWRYLNNLYMIEQLKALREPWFLIKSASLNLFRSPMVQDVLLSSGLCK